MSEHTVRCVFHLRTMAKGGYRYTILRGQWRTMDHALATVHPPEVGDLVTVGSGQYLVLARAWNHATHGSGYWPRDKAVPYVGALLDFVVIDDPGLFADEAPFDPAEEE